MNPETKTEDRPEGRAEIKQHLNQSIPGEAPEILAQGLVAHVGFVIEEQPYVIPFTYHFDPASPGELYLHGSPESRALQHLADGAPVCVEVSLLDGLVYSKMALYHSMNYRSVVCFGRARIVEDEAEKRGVFEKMIGRYFKGRSAPRDYTSPAPEHLGATVVLKLTIEDWSAKARRGGPNGPHDKNPETPGSAGVVDLDRPKPA